MMAVTMLWCIGELLTVFLMCRPLAYNWDSSIDATCGNVLGGYLSVHIFNFVIDLIIALLPAPVLWKLQMPKGKKVGIAIIFALGALYVSPVLCLPDKHTPAHIITSSL